MVGPHKEQHDPSWEFEGDSLISSSNKTQSAHREPLDFKTTEKNTLDISGEAPNKYKGTQVGLSILSLPHSLACERKLSTTSLTTATVILPHLVVDSNCSVSQRAYTC